MEGIRDGQAVDQCFYCALVFPSLEECPRCLGRVHYRPASLASDEDLSARCLAAWKEFASTKSTETAENLARLAFELGDQVDELLGKQWLAKVREILRAQESLP